MIMPCCSPSRRVASAISYINSARLITVCAIDTKKAKRGGSGCG